MAKDLTKALTKDPSNKFFDKKLDSEAYNIVATKSTLLAIQMVSSNFDIKPEFFSKKDKVKIDLCHEILAIDFHDSGDVILGIFRYEIVAKIVRKHVMTAHADFMVVYAIPEGSSENEAKAFCARVGLFAAYPYFRSLFANYSSAANVEFPPLPVLSADPLRKPTGKQSTVKDNK